MVDPTSGVSSTSNSANNISTNNAIMGKDDFLKMMIAQLKNQDPMNPMDGTQYASQLAQFSSLEQLSNLNSTMTQSLAGNSQLTQSINNMMVSNLIGKDTKLTGSDIQVNGQTKIDLGYNLPMQASSVEVDIYDSNGGLVKTINNSSLSKGDSKLSWDLTDNSGSKVPNSNYTFKVTATDANGNDITTTQYKYGIIDGVKFNSSGTVLLIDGAEYNISEVSEITNTNNNGNGQ